MWQRFSDGARKMVFYAQEEAGRLGENYVSTEHFLLGLLREPSNAGCQVLNRLGISLERVRTEIEQQVAKGEGRLDQDMQLTPRAKRVIDLAYDEARQQAANYIGSQHMLLGLIRESEGLGGRTLAKLGVGLDAARQIVMDMEGEPGTVLDAEGSVAGARTIEDGSPARVSSDPPQTPSESDKREAFNVDAVIEGQIANARRVSAQMKGIVDDTRLAELDAAASAMEDMRRRHLDELNQSLKLLAEKVQSVVAEVLDRRSPPDDKSTGDQD